LEALRTLGIPLTKRPAPPQGSIFAPCRTGGCYACTVLVNGEPRPSCHTPLLPGQRIQTSVSEREVTPLRIAGWYTPHPVGGVGTPWTAKAHGREARTYIEVACFTAGCNLRCLTCQNFDVTYNSSAPPVTPREAAEKLSLLRRRVGVNRLAVSGGEPTLNRPWLIQFFRELRRLNSDPKARLHLDTNASLLTPDYIDELVEAGVTDIGPDLKAARLATYQTITGIADKELARQYLETSWRAVKHLTDHHYPERVFVGVGLPFNPAFYPSEEAMEEELHEWASRLVAIDDRVQVCLLDYRPEFRRREIRRPTPQQMRQVKELLEGAGLRTVIAQTRIGHLPPLQPSPDIEPRPH